LMSIHSHEKVHGRCRQDVLLAMEVDETDGYEEVEIDTSVREYGGYSKRLLFRAFPQLKDHADDILLQQFKAIICQDVITFTILRSVPDSFGKRSKLQHARSS
ncbi:hypothetical protein T4C_3159, partial [Trichinella pseudospiralis]